MNTITQRLKFEPSYCNPNGLLLDILGDDWVTIICCTASFPLECFEEAISQLIHHPEYNSTLILRSEVLSEGTSNFPEQIPSFRDRQRMSYIHRKLLPRRPGRDSPLEQFCTIYATSDGPAIPDTLVLTPVLRQGTMLPYYHPSVSQLAFRYLNHEQMLQIEVIPHPDTPKDINSRLFRTCLSLLETLHRYGWGVVTNYKKRVIHDCLVPRGAYQDLYLIMRERHKHLIDTWQEVTDPLKHVFEDIGIATFLMLLWKDSFSPTENPGSGDASPEPWKTWPRPPAGFLDLGCGNGLLTHILISEGYQGFGIDVRTRSSWEHYPRATQAFLKVHAFNPTVDDRESQMYFKTGVFVIGNHADEMTPWLPVVSTLYEASGYISIPCCSWAFDAKYDRSKTPLYPLPDVNFANTLNLGGDGSHKSSYSMYRIWLASLGLHCGWQVECEMLRIPSTRNWAIIGRKRNKATAPARSYAISKAIVAEVKARGIFRTRKPEGKSDDH